MRNPLDRRLIALERARGARGVDLRIFGSRAEAAADTEPPRRGMKVIRIITGVRRSLDASPARLDDIEQKMAGGK